MSNDERAERDTTDSQSAGSAGETTTTLSAWLRALAKRAESDAAFAAQMLDAARESGLSDALGDVAPQQSTRPATRRRKATPTTTPTSSTAPVPDPFAVYRAQGVEGLRAALDALDLPTLRAIVRERRLDPARISARWTARERVISLIVDQVKARANHGQAFRHV